MGKKTFKIVTKDGRRKLVDLLIKKLSNFQGTGKKKLKGLIF